MENFFKAKCVQEFITVIDKLYDHYTVKNSGGKNFLDHTYQIRPHFIYRGHSDENYKLIPGVLRYEVINDGKSLRSCFSTFEFDILNDFIAESNRFVNSIDSNDYKGWLEIAQHYGVPTRLLDFTENPLISLYFACVHNLDKDGVVWLINEYAFNQIIANNYGPMLIKDLMFIINSIITNEILMPQGISKYEYPLIYKPYYREERMNLQSSLFMLWGHNQRELEELMPKNYMNLDSIPNPESIMGKIKIPREEKQNILAQLNMMGINEKSIYPGLDGIGKYIRKKYS